jgi:hypothetical protein
MISHPNEHVEEFVSWVQSVYGVKTRKMSATWWGRFLQWCPLFNMAAIQLGHSIWINDEDRNRDGERDWWRDDQPFGCIALVAHELWHVLQKRRNKLSRWQYLRPQIYAVFTLPGIIVTAVMGLWLALLPWVSLMVYFLLPAHAPERLRIEAETYSWNRLVASLLCDEDQQTLSTLRERTAKLLASGSYYWPTRRVGEARTYLEAYRSTPDTTPALAAKVKETVLKLKAEIH